MILIYLTFLFNKTGFPGSFANGERTIGFFMTFIISPVLSDLTESNAAFYK